MRQFVSGKAPDKKGLLEIGGSDFKYFRQVLRLVQGDMLSVRLPDGSLVNTTVALIDEKKRTVTLQLCGDKGGEKGENQSGYSAETDFYLFQFEAKGPKMDLIIRQAAETGITKVIPVSGQFSQNFGKEKNQRSLRYERIIKEARQQSGSPVATQVTSSMTLKEALLWWKEETAGFEKESFACVLYERSEKTQNLFDSLAQTDTVKKCAVFCGAEGGISPDEIDFLCENGVIPVHLETNILRCETAALYGTACVQNVITGRKKWQTVN